MSGFKSGRLYSSMGVGTVTIAINRLYLDVSRKIWCFVKVLHGNLRVESLPAFSSSTRR